MKLFTLAFLCVLCASSAFAQHIGETVKQADARYGPPVNISVSSAGAERTYEKNGLEIVASFVNGRIASLRFDHRDRVLSDDETERLILEQGRITHRPVEKDPEDKSHISGIARNGEKFEVFSEYPVIRISTARYIAAWEKANRERERIGRR